MTTEFPPVAPVTLDVSAGRRLTVRPATADDVDALMQLYAGLSSEDRYRRFFSSQPPQRSFVAKYVGSEDGVTLLAEVTGPDGATELVGEAGFRAIPGQEPEFSATIATAWRGWLGPWLLDRLLTVAADRGLTYLMADVLVRNKQMLAILARRGYATVDHPDWTTVRVIVGTATRTPPWPDSQPEPRVLAVAPGGRWYAEDALRAAGIHVLVCPGPKGRRGNPCPLLQGERCHLVEGAQAVVVALSPSDPAAQQVVAAHVAGTHAPLCIQSWPGGAPPEFADQEGVTVLPSGTDEAELVAWALQVTGTAPSAD